MTAGERLQQLSGLSGVTAAAMLIAIGAGVTAGAALVNYSGLSSGTAAEHLLVDKQPFTPAHAGGGGRRFIHDGIIFNIEEDDEELIMMLTACAPLLNKRH